MMARRNYDDFTGGVFPIQVREDLVIRLHPVPHDLSKAEAEKICRVIMALAG